MTISKIQIIGGRWRHRWIEFPALPVLRPTPNRVRETLFNWLMHDIRDAVCIDAFAGSGALGLEALSRGARKVIAFEKNPQALTALRRAQIILEASQLEIIASDFFTTTHLPNAQLIFLDPPFHQNLFIPALNHLAQLGCLTHNNKIYFEVEKNFDFNNLPANFEFLKKQKAGEVCFGLGTLGISQC